MDHELAAIAAEAQASGARVHAADLLRTWRFELEIALFRAQADVAALALGAQAGHIFRNQYYQPLPSNEVDPGYLDNDELEIAVDSNEWPDDRPGLVHRQQTPRLP